MHHGWSQSQKKALSVAETGLKSGKTSAVAAEVLLGIALYSTDNEVLSKKGLLCGR